jgi:DNA-binding transcriptional MocR family regulator
MARKAQQLTGVMVRLPEKLRRWMQRAAAENGRSMNSEIIYRLERSIATEPELERVMARLEEQMKKRQAELLRELQQIKRAGNGEEGKS